MKSFIVMAICLVPVMAFGQQTYTNEDLAKFQVPGAYNNEDLRRLGPLAVQKEPAVHLPRYEPSRPAGGALQARYGGLIDTYKALMWEIAYEEERIDFSESAFAGDTRDPEVRLGYRSQVAHWLAELTKRAELVKSRIERVVDDARRAGITLKRR